MFLLILCSYYVGLETDIGTHLSSTLPNRTPAKYRMSLRLNFPLSNKSELLKFEESITVPISEAVEGYAHAQDNCKRLVSLQILYSMIIVGLNHLLSVLFIKDLFLDAYSKNANVKTLLQAVFAETLPTTVNIVYLEKTLLFEKMKGIYKLYISSMRPLELYFIKYQPTLYFLPICTSIL